MSDIVERLHIPPGPGQTITQNYRMMVEERAEAANEIERLLDICKDKTALLKDAYAANERLRALVKDLADDMEAELNGYYRDMENVYKARRALEHKP